MSSLIRFVPHAREITNISNASPGVVTTSVPHGYYDDIFVTIVIPYPKMMPQLNNETFRCKILSPTTFSIYDSSTFLPVNTVNLGLFATSATQVCQAVPSGEFATTLLNVSNVIGPRNPLG